MARTPFNYIYSEHACELPTREEYGESFQYWFMQLSERVNNLCVWRGLPLSIPQREIEFRLNMGGQCWVEQYKKNVRVFDSSFANQNTIYLDEPSQVNIYSPIFSATCKRDEGVLIRNNDYILPTRLVIKHYADKLAHCDLSLTNAMVNTRAKNVPISASAKMTESLRSWVNRLWSGRVMPIEDKSFSMVEFQKMDTGASTAIIEILDARKSILQEFYECFGIRNSKIKKAQMTNDEVEAGDAMLLVNVKNMLECRQAGACEINEKFGLNVTVDFCDELKQQFDNDEKGVELWQQSKS